MGALAAGSDAGVVGGLAWDALAKGKDAIVDIGAGQVSFEDRHDFHSAQQYYFRVLFYAL